MAQHTDANLKLVYPVDAGAFFTLDTVTIGDAFDVIANVEIGSSMMEVIDEHTVFASVRNISRDVIASSTTFNAAITPVVGGPDFTQEVRIPIPAGWAGQDGDIMQVVATYKARAGARTDYSQAESSLFIAVS